MSSTREINELHRTKLNREYYRVFKGNNHSKLAGQLQVHASDLRHCLVDLADLVEESDPNCVQLGYIDTILGLTRYLAEDYVDPDYNLDRKLSSGEIKDGNTGEIRDAPVHKSDLPKDLPTSNKGF